MRKFNYIFLIVLLAFILSGCTGSPIGSAGRKGNLAEVNRLIAQGADVNAKNLIGEAPLHWSSVKSNNIAVIKTLIDAGADVNLKSNAGNTPLMISGSHGNIENSKLLIAEGADVSLRNKRGWTHIDWARNVTITKPAYANYFEGEYAKQMQAKLEQEKKQQEIKRNEERKKHIAALKKKQKCGMKERNWIYMGKHCKKRYAHGKGTAVHVDGNLKFEGTIKNGKRISGELFYNGQSMFDGPIAKGRPNGKGICYYENEPEKCEFYRGKRVDSIYKQRIALAKQDAKQQADMQKLRDDMKSLQNSQTSSGGTQTDSMGNLIKKELVRKGVKELFNQLY